MNMRNEPIDSVYLNALSPSLANNDENDSRRTSRTLLAEQRSSRGSPSSAELKAEDAGDEDAKFFVEGRPSSGSETPNVGYAENGDEAEDENLVTWSGPDDKENPKNWSYAMKWVVTTLVSLISFVTTFSSSSIAPALPQIASEFHITTQVEQSLPFAIFGVGFVVGALPYGPLSELYGRTPVLHVSFAFFVIFTIASGFSKTFAQLVVFRLLAGIGGSAPNTVGAGVVADCFHAEDIGRGSAFYGLAPRLGPSLGPLVGGFIVQNLGWRWGFWITSMLAGALLVFGFVFIRETRPSILLKKKAQRMQKETGNQSLRTKEWPREISDWEFLRQGLKRPLVFLGTHHIVQYLALYQFFVAGTLYLILSTYHSLFTNVYHESIQISGLNYISIALGLVLGNQLCSRVSDKVYDYLRHHPKLPSLDESDPNAGRPEYRVPMMMVGVVLYPIGFLIYGWTANYKVFWLLPNIGIFFVAFGIIVISQGIKLYNVSTYGTFAASATGAINITRAIGTSVFPLFASYMIEDLGYGRFGTVLAGIAIALGIPGPILLWKYGPRLRKNALGLQKRTVRERPQGR